VPDRKFEQHLNTVLRDDILVQLRAAGRPLSTSELRTNAPTQPLKPGGPAHYLPPQERVYRALLKLQADGKTIKHRSTGRIVTWSAARSADDDEIDRLEWRVAQTKDRLREERPSLAEIADRVAYQSASAFTTAFMRVTGAARASTHAASEQSTATGAVGYLHEL
jgi:hypothetical protein